MECVVTRPLAVRRSIEFFWGGEWGRIQSRALKSGQEFVFVPRGAAGYRYSCTFEGRATVSGRNVRIAVDGYFTTEDMPLSGERRLAVKDLDALCKKYESYSC